MLDLVSKVFRKVTKFYLLTLTFLLPLKFSSLAIMPDAAGYFPTNYLEYILVQFPASALGIFSGLGLVLAIIAYSSKLKFDKNRNYILLVSWISLSLISLLGIINASTLDYVYLSIAHILGVVSYIASIYLMVTYDKKSINLFFTLIAISAIITLIVGLYQYFWGFDEQIKFYQEQAKDSVLMQQISNKIYEKRIYSTYGSCNVFGGYLLLILGILLIQLNKFSEHFEPVNLTKKIVVSLGVISLAFVIFNTGSRAAFASVIGAFIIMILLSKRSKKFKISLGASLITLGTIGVIATHFMGRTFGSFTERLGYIRSSLLMLWNNFFFGSGWGDFMVDNQKYRIINVSEAARDPHNIFLTFGSQAGIVALLIVMFCFLYPLYLMAKKYLANRSLDNGLILFSMVAFLAHSMIELNYQIPASFALAGAIFTVVALKDDTDDETLIDVKPKVYQHIIMLLISMNAIMSIYLSVYNVACDKAYDNFATKAENLSYKYTRTDVEKAFLVIDMLKPYSPFHNNVMFKYAIRNQYDADKILEYGKKAIQNSPERSGFYDGLSHFYGDVMHDPINAEKYKNKAIELAPYTAKIH